MPFCSGHTSSICWSPLSSCRHRELDQEQDEAGERGWCKTQGLGDHQWRGGGGRPHTRCSGDEQHSGDGSRARGDMGRVRGDMGRVRGNGGRTGHDKDGSGGGGSKGG